MNLSPTYVFRLDCAKFRHFSDSCKSGVVKNPVGYKRMITGRMRAESARYLAWMRFVREELAVTTADAKVLLAAHRNEHVIYLESDQYARMDIIIAWADETHGDADNVWKGIADSLFKQDKHVAGSFEFGHLEGKKTGFVDVNIWIEKAAGRTPGSSFTRPGRDNAG